MSQSIRNGLSTVPELDDVQFNRWQGLLEERTGMFLPQQRRSFLQTSLGLRMLELGIRDYGEYYEKIDRDTTPDMYDPTENAKLGQAC